MIDLDLFVKENDKVLVDFWAVWCMPCKTLNPVLKKFEDKHSDIKILKINVDEEPELVKRLNVVSIPTLFYYDKGDMINRTTGVLNYDGLEKFVDRK